MFFRTPGVGGVYKMLLETRSCKENNWTLFMICAVSLQHCLSLGLWCSGKNHQLEVVLMQLGLNL